MNLYFSTFSRSASNAMLKPQELVAMVPYVLEFIE